MADDSKVVAEAKKLTYIEDEKCDMGHYAKGLYVIRLDKEPFLALCPDCLKAVLERGLELINQRRKEEVNPK